MTTNNSNTNNSRRDFIRNSAMVAAGAMVLPRLTLGATPNIVSSLPLDRWPGRLVVDGKTLDDFVAIKEEASADPAWTIRLFQSVSVPELQIRAQWRTIGAVTEWIPTLVNNAAKSSGKVTELRSLAASWRTRGPVDFYGTNGSKSAGPEDFADRTELDIDLVELVPRGGRSSDGIFPFFALTDRHDAMAIGIGWSGRWCATLKHASGNLQVEVGLPEVGFVLRPWESVRLPSVLLARAPEASVDQARRLVRSHLTQHVVPRTPDGKSPNFTAHGPVYDYLVGLSGINEAGEFEALERAAALGFETYWVDACWFGNERDQKVYDWWSPEAGNWFVDRSAYPRGLRPISDRAHELGMKFMFWLEPERARMHTEWARTYPDLFLSYPGDNSDNWWKRENLLLNLGDPRAVDLAFNKISSLITEFNADIYRQDFNTTPLDAWYAADAPDRVGITEIRYVEGLYTLWDRVLAAHPGILIDNCASGGRRIDLETLRRSMPIWRSDAGIDDKYIPQINLMSQIQGWGAGHWLPDQSSAAVTFDAYATRGTLSTGIASLFGLSKDENAPESADIIAAMAENRRLRPLVSEERIGLIAPTLEEAWMAFQHHRHSDSSGIIVALRGPGAADADSVTLRPEHINARSTYQVTRWDDYRASPPARIAGSELKEMLVTIPQIRSSVLVEYQRV